MNKKLSFWDKAWKFISDFFSKLGKILLIIFSKLEVFLIHLIDFLFNFIEKIMQGVYFLLKLILQFIKNILFAVAALIFAIGALVYFISLAFGLPDSEPFQESRDFWVSTQSILLSEGLKNNFNDKQENIPVELRFYGALPDMDLPEPENEARIKALADYYSSWDDELKDYETENFARCELDGYEVSEARLGKKCETPDGETFYDEYLPRF